MLWVFRWIKGYLRVTFSGESCEKVLNICAKNRITLWDLRLVKKDIEACIYIKDFKLLRFLIRKCNVRVKILKKSGLPFLIRKNRNRLGIIIGLAVFFSFLQIMSGFIWIIDVEGNKSVKRAEILENCKSIGIYEGVRKKSINAKNSREKLLLKTKDIAWASLNIEGSRLTVNLSEIKKSGKKNFATNLKASADGIIKHIDIKSGNCLVKSGDTVKKGDILVSGIIESAEVTKFVESKGSITAETEREISLSEKYSITQTLNTGKIKHKKVLDIFSLKLPLYLGNEIKGYSSELKVKQASLFGQSLPIRVYDRKISYTKRIKAKLNETQIRNLLEKRLESEIKKLKTENYTLKSKDFVTSPDGATLKAIITAEENIAVSQKMLVNSTENSEDIAINRKENND